MSAVEAATALAAASTATAPRKPPMRKLLLRRRQELSFGRQAFEHVWDQYFPRHDLVTLRLKRAKSKAEAYWDAPSWKAAARWYHEQRQGRVLIVEPPDAKQIKLLYRLLADELSLERAWGELNKPEKRPAPQTTIEAIMYCVRERGIGTLKEPANIERLERCDAAALAQINERIRKLKQGNKLKGIGE